MKLAKYKRYLAVARSRMAYENYWRELLAFDAEMQRRGLILGLPYWHVKPREWGQRDTVAPRSETK